MQLLGLLNSKQTALHFTKSIDKGMYFHTVLLGVANMFDCEESISKY